MSWPLPQRIHAAAPTGVNNMHLLDCPPLTPIHDQCLRCTQPITWHPAEQIWLHRADHPTEREIVAAQLATAEDRWLRQFLTERGIGPKRSTTQNGPTAKQLLADAYRLEERLYLLAPAWQRRWPIPPLRRCAQSVSDLVYDLRRRYDDWRAKPPCPALRNGAHCMSAGTARSGRWRSATVGRWVRALVTATALAVGATWLVGMIMLATAHPASATVLERTLPVIFIVYGLASAGSLLLRWSARCGQRSREVFPDA